MEMTITNNMTATVPVGDTASLDAHEAGLREQLKQSMISGDAPKVIDARKELAEIPIRRRAFELAEEKKALDALEDRFDQNAKDEAGMVELRREIDARLQPALDVVAAIGQEMTKCEFCLSLVYSERQGLIEERRERRANIAKIVKDIEESL